MFKTQKPKAPTTKPKWGNTCNFYQQPMDLNAMDMSPGQIKGCVAEVSDFTPGGNRWHQSVNNLANRPNKFQPAKPREVICYCCGNAGHIAHNCPQKPPPNLQGPWVGQSQRQPQQGPSCMHWQEVDVEEEKTNIQAVCDDRPAEE